MPQYQLSIEEARSEGDSYTYRMKFRYTGEGEGPSSHLSIRDDEPLPKFWDLGLKLLNADGKDVFEVGGASGGMSRGSSGSGSNDEYTASGHGTCGGCGGVKTVQFRFAVNPSEVELSYVVNDIPVPIF